MIRREARRWERREMTSLIGVLCLCTLVTACGQRRNPVSVGYAEERDLEFEVYTVTYRRVNRDLEGLGNLVVYDKATVVPRIDGIVQNRYVTKGEPVRKGDAILELSNYQLELEKFKAEKDVLTAREELETARVRYLEEVHDLQKRFFLIEKLELQVENIRCEIGHLRDHVDRKRRLFERGGITEEELRNLEFSIEAKQREREMLEKELEIQSHGFGDEDLIAQEMTVPADEDERKRKIIFINTKLSRKRIEFAEIRLNKATLELEKVEWLLGQRVVSSPIDGIVTEVVKFPGEKVNVDEPVTTVINQDHLVGRISFPEQDRSRIEKGMEAFVFVESTGEEFPGYITSIDPVIDESTRSFYVDCLIRNDRGLVPGMFVKARIPVQKASRHLLIPRSAFIRENESEGYVYTASSNSRIFKTPVVCEEYDDDQLIVHRGLSENDCVILHPILNLMDGTRIRVVE